MIIDNDPPITRNISVPRDMSSLSCSSFTAGIVEAVLDGLGFVRHCQLLTSSANWTHELAAVGACYSTQHTNGTISEPNNCPHQAREVCSGAGGSAEDVERLRGYCYVQRSGHRPRLLSRAPWSTPGFLSTDRVLWRGCAKNTDSRH